MIGVGLLAGCQSAGKAPPPEARADAWRVIERVGEARYLAPGARSWAAALPATALPGGSQVATGAGGRLILARAADHVSAGPGSQFSLPAAVPGAALEQTAGRLRYRLAGPPAFAVATPALAIEVQDSVFDVTVGADATEIAVEQGRLRVATPDGEREIRLEAGQSAHAGGHEVLAFRRASGQPLERVERLILPALQPKPEVAESSPGGSSLTVARAANNQASTSAAASVESAVPVATAAPSAGASEPVASAARATLPAATGATATTMGSVPSGPGRPPGEGGPAAAPAPIPDPTAPIPGPTDPIGGRADPIRGRTDPIRGRTDPIRGPTTGPIADPTLAPAPDVDPTTEATGDDPRLLFDRLTEGMIDAIPAQRTPQAPPAHARAI